MILTVVCLTIQGTLTTAILSGIILTLKILEIYLLGGDSDSERSYSLSESPPKRYISSIFNVNIMSKSIMILGDKHFCHSSLGQCGGILTRIT